MDEGFTLEGPARGPDRPSLIAAPAASMHPGDTARLDADVFQSPSVEFCLPRLGRLVWCPAECDRRSNNRGIPDVNGAICESADQLVHRLLLQMTMRHRTP